MAGAFSRSSQTPPLVGRGREQTVLRDALAAAMRGRGGLALIGGEAGIGKTALAEWLCREAEGRGALVLVGRCYDLTQTPPYGPWREIAARWPASADLPPLPSALTEDAGGAESASQATLFAGARRAVGALAAQRPLVLLLDDVHWADSASLDLLRYLARDLGDAALLLLATYRSDELTSQRAFAQLLPALVREGRAVRLDLRPLEAADVDALIAGRYPLPDADRERLAVHLYARAEGNPFFTVELLRSLADERVLRPAETGWRLGDLAGVRVPEGVREVVAARVARLGVATRDLLQAAAILGDHCTVAFATAVCCLPECAVLDALDRATAAGMLRAEADRYRFAHPLIREAIYEGLSPPRRAALHLKAADAIERLCAGDLSSSVAVLAGHYQRAGEHSDGEKAIHYSVRAAEAATAVFAHAEAAHHYRAALARLPAGDAERRCDLLLHLADALLRAGNPGQIAEEIAPAALELAQRLGDNARCWRACAAAVAAITALGASAILDTPMYRVWVERADRYAAPGTIERVRADRDLARVRWAMGREADAWELSVRALALARALGDTEASFVAAAHILDMPWAPRHWRDRLLLARESAGWSREGISTRTALTWLTACGRILLDWGDRAGAEDCWYERDGIAQRAGEAQYLTEISTYRAIRALLDGHLDGALDHAGRLIAEATERGMAIRGQQFASVVRVRALLHLGRADEAIAAIPAARHLAERDAPSVVGVSSLYAGRLALALAHAGQEGEARALLQRFLREGGVGRAADDTEAPTLSVVYFLEAAILLGDTAAADALAAPLIPLAECATADMALTCVARHLGGAAALRGDRDAAGGYYAQALDVARRIGFRAEMALIRLQWGELLLTDAAGGADARSRAEELLDDAIPELCAMRMQPALDRALRAREILAPRTAQARNDTLPDRLTPREAEVLGLLASGSTNKEMARRLSLSARTVERHIANIYTKIGAHGRAEATAYALRHGIYREGCGDAAGGW